jgi:putative transposase
LVRKALVHSASSYDRDGGRLLVEALPELHEQFPRLRPLWVAVAYQGRFVEWVQQTFGGSVQVVKHWWTGVSTVWVFPGQEVPEIPAGFQLLTWRWIVARTFAWLGRSRRLSKDDAFLPETGVALIYVAMCRLLLRRLAQTP